MGTRYARGYRSSFKDGRELTRKPRRNRRSKKKKVKFDKEAMKPRKKTKKKRQDLREVKTSYPLKVNKIRRNKLTPNAKRKETTRKIYGKETGRKRSESKARKRRKSKSRQDRDTISKATCTQRDVRRDSRLRFSRSREDKSDRSSSDTLL